MKMLNVSQTEVPMPWDKFFYFYQIVYLYKE